MDFYFTIQSGRCVSVAYVERREMHHTHARRLYDKTFAQTRGPKSEQMAEAATCSPVVTRQEVRAGSRC